MTSYFTLYGEILYITTAVNKDTIMSPPNTQE